MATNEYTASMGKINTKGSHTSRNTADGCEKMETHLVHEKTRVESVSLTSKIHSLDSKCPCKEVVMECKVAPCLMSPFVDRLSAWGSNSDASADETSITAM